MEKKVPETYKPPCSGSDCDFTICTETNEIYCRAGEGTCINCNLLEAEPSRNHDEHLMKATNKINRILAEIPEDPEGRKLSFLLTDKGLFLARVHHGRSVPANAITAKDDINKISKALKIKD